MDVLPLLKELSAGLPADRKESLKNQLARYLNHLLLHDFGALVQLLYTIDVPEQKLKTALQQNQETDAGLLMAELIIQRQEQKKTAKDLFIFRPDDHNEDRW
jgi:hypothetical protein